MRAAATRPAGQVGLTVIKRDVWLPERFRTWKPKSELGIYVRALCQQLKNPAQVTELLERLSRTLVVESSLALQHFRGALLVDDMGIVCRRVVTTAGVNFIAARMAGTTPSNISNFNFHGIGTGSTAEAIGDTALVTELTTQYNPDNTRATGTQSNPSANVYQTVGTNTVDSAVAITEHGVFTQAATGGGTLLDRSIFSAVNLANGDSLQSTYQLTLTAGG